MKKYITLIENGHYKDVFLLTADEIEQFELEEGQELIETPKPSGVNAFVKPFWDGEKWIEKATQEEIDEHNYRPPQLPTLEERLLATEQALLALMEVLS